MNIKFPGPVIPIGAHGISVRAIVDGMTVACIFTSETLEDVEPGLSAADRLTQFEASRGVLLAIADRKIRGGQVVNRIVRIFNTDLYRRISDQDEKNCSTPSDNH